MFALIAALAVFAWPGEASARHDHHHHAAYRITREKILGHRVTTISWRPGGRVWLRATYSRVRRSPLAWGNAVGGLVTMNADTWQWKTSAPTGPARAQGRWITQPPHPWSSQWDRPAVGFYSTGGLVFGAATAAQHGAANIVSGPAYLIRSGVIQRSFPWAHGIQINCGPPGTDGSGCWRSNVVRFNNGRVGLVEIGFASMPTAARILRRMHVDTALTLDSGGSSVLGWRKNSAARWQQDGIQHAIGSTWLRPVPEAIVLMNR